MARVRASWLMGSIEEQLAQLITINVSPSAFAGGPWYLTHTNPVISMSARMVTLMLAAGVVAPAVDILENRLVRLSSSGVFSVTWGSGLQARDFFGFAGNLAGLDTYVADVISPYLWSPGFPVTKATITGRDGFDVEDAELKVSADGSRQETDLHITHKWDDWQWEAVPKNRYDDLTSLGGGTWVGFRRNVVVPGHRFQLYEIVTEESASTAPVTLPAPLETYRMREIPKGHGTRKIEHANSYWRVGMRVRVTSDYS